MTAFWLICVPFLLFRITATILLLYQYNSIESEEFKQNIVDLLEDNERAEALCDEFSLPFCCLLNWKNKVPPKPVMFEISTWMAKNK